MRDLPVFLLTTSGRKTGKKRTTSLGYFKDEGGYVITASNAGLDTHPGWFHNLRSDSLATIEVNDQRFEVLAEIAGGKNATNSWRG